MSARLLSDSPLDPPPTPTSRLSDRECCIEPIRVRSVDSPGTTPRPAKTPVLAGSLASGGARVPGAPGGAAGGVLAGATQGRVRSPSACAAAGKCAASRYTTGL